MPVIKQINMEEMKAEQDREAEELRDFLKNY